MKVLTFGWEFPPSKNGGLGVACHGLTRELLDAGVEVIFVLPRSQKTVGNAKFLFAEYGSLVSIRQTDITLEPYQQSDTKMQIIVGYTREGMPIYQSRTILEEVHRFAHQASIIAKQEKFDVIHAHDWTSYLAGVAAKLASGKPLVVHVHATSFDQAGGNNVDPSVFKIEQEGFAMADAIVTVSNYTRNMVVEKHLAPAEKVIVVHNGCDSYEPVRHEPTLRELRAMGKKFILYHGRISIQKGVDYFIHAARKVVDVDKNIIFIVSGWGDMLPQIIEQVGKMGLSENVRFAGALWEDERDRMYQSVDLVVMPSVSEPFGLVPLEALQHGTPSIITKQSGVGEVLTHALKVDFWDTDEMANQILAAMRYPVIRTQMVQEGKQQMKTLSWQQAAKKVKNIYQSLLRLATQ